MIISPLKSDINGHGLEPHSLRDAIRRIDNEKDMREYILSFSSKVPPKHADIQFERHPVRLSFSRRRLLLNSHRHSRPLSRCRQSRIASHSNT